MACGQAETSEWQARNVIHYANSNTGLTDRWCAGPSLVDRRGFGQGGRVLRDLLDQYGCRILGVTPPGAGLFLVHY